MRILLSIIVVVVSVHAAEAQPQYLPFTKSPVSQEVYARAIEFNDSRVLNATATEMVDAMGRQFPELEISSPAELAMYIRHLSVIECPQTKAVLGRVDTRLKKVDLDGRGRLLRQGELCLYDNNEGLWIASLSCGNIIVSHLPVFKAMVTEEVLPSENPIMVTGSRLVQGLSHHSQEQEQEGEDSVPRKNWMARNWKWVAPVAAVAAGAIVCGVACRSTVTQRQEVFVY